MSEKQVNVRAGKLFDRDLKIIIDSDVPREVREAISELLPEVLTAVPPRLRSIRLFWNDEDGDNTAASQSHVEYAKLSIYVTAGWMSRTRDDRLQVLMHEVAHYWVAPLWDQAREHLQELTRSSAPSEAAMVRRTLDHSLEQVVEDLSHFMLLTTSYELAPVKVKL